MGSYSQEGKFHIKKEWSSLFAFPRRRIWQCARCASFTGLLSSPPWGLCLVMGSGCKNRDGWFLEVAIICSRVQFSCHQSQLSTDTSGEQENSIGHPSSRISVGALTPAKNGVQNHAYRRVYHRTDFNCESLWVAHFYCVRNYWKCNCILFVAYLTSLVRS